METWKEVWEMRKIISMHIDKVESNEASEYVSGYLFSIIMQMCKIHCYHKDHHGA